MERCDVTDAAALAAHVERRASQVTAGSTRSSRWSAASPAAALLETDRATWDRMLALNLTSAYTADARGRAPACAAAGAGRVVLIASRAALPPSGGFIAYTVAKAAIVTLRAGAGPGSCASSASP